MFFAISILGIQSFKMRNCYYDFGIFFVINFWLIGRIQLIGKLIKKVWKFLYFII